MLTLTALITGSMVSHLKEIMECGRHYFKYLYDGTVLFIFLTPQVGMATLIFQSYRGVSRKEEGSLKLEDFMLEQLGKLTTTSRYWTMFRVGKQATRLVNMSL